VSLAQLYHVPYSGNIEPVTEVRAKTLAVDADKDSNVARIFDAQTERLGAMADYVRAPAVAGGLIVRCPAEEVQGIYDVVFGSGSAQPKSATILQFPQNSQQSALQSVFGESAAKFRAGIDFPKAASLRADNYNAPALNRTLDAA
jgi:hypothetical protein